MAEHLSPNFTLEELIYSNTAKAKKISNAPTEVHKRNLKNLCTKFLEPLRALLNSKYKTYCRKNVKSVNLKITSGYRSAALNSAIKGSSKTSQHLQGCAADCKAIIVFVDDTRKELPYTELYENIKAWVKAGKISVDQCIQEKAGNSVWVHCSYKSDFNNNRKQFLKYNGSTYKLDIWLK